MHDLKIFHYSLVEAISDFCDDKEIVKFDDETVLFTRIGEAIDKEKNYLPVTDEEFKVVIQIEAHVPRSLSVIIDHDADLSRIWYITNLRTKSVDAIRAGIANSEARRSAASEKTEELLNEGSDRDLNTLTSHLSGADIIEIEPE